MKNWLLTQLIIVLVSGFWLVSKSLRSESPRVRQKGRLLLYAFTLFPIVSILEVLVPLVPIIILARLLSIITIILTYGGFVLPKWMENLFLKRKEKEE